MTALPPVPTLEGDHVRLEPLTADHAAALAVAAAEDRVNYGWTEVPDGSDAVRASVTRLLDEQAAGEAMPFAQVRMSDGTPVGATRFLTFRFDDGAEHPYAVEIGGTWLGASAQGTAINSEAKLLLLGHAFDVWGVGRVDLKTDARNDRSRAAISAIGASFEGILRSWQPSQVEGEEDLLRDTAMFSVVASEWAEVRLGLAQRVARLAR